MDEDDLGWGYLASLILLLVGTALALVTIASRIAQ